MKSISILMSAALIAGMSTNASAEPALGSRLGSNLESHNQVYSPAEADRKARAMVSCGLAKHAVSAQSLLDAADKRTADKATRALLSEENCNMLGEARAMSDTTQFTYPTDVLRGMIAEQMVSNRLEQARVLPRLPIERTYSRPWFAMTGREAVVDAMAVCLSENDPANVVGLLRTQAYSPAEMAAVQALGPTLGQCLQVGYKLRANRQTLRAAVAEGLYHRLMTPAAVAPAGK